MAMHSCLYALSGGCFLLIMICLVEMARCQDLHLFKEEYLTEEDDFYIEITNEISKDRIRRADGILESTDGSGDSTPEPTDSGLQLTFSSTQTTIDRLVTTSYLPTDDEDGEGSGSNENAPGSFIRISIIVTDYLYLGELASRSSDYFTALSSSLQDAVAALYSNTNGDQTATVLQFLDSNYGVEVHFDLETYDFYNEGALRSVLEGAVRRGSIDTLQVLPGHLNWELVSNQCQFTTCPIDFTCVPTLEKYLCTPVTDSGSTTTQVFPTIPPPDSQCRGDSDFPCRDGIGCVSSRQLCDYTVDCRDASDELDCDFTSTTNSVNTVSTSTTTSGNCLPGEARCQSNEQCIPDEYRCDREYDCDDRSDEIGCPDVPCEPNEFHCDNQNCAQKIWLCDGDDDCGDGSDEVNCPTAGPGELCTASEFECFTNLQCVPKAFQCDNDNDCIDRSDEHNCTSPTVTDPPVSMITVMRGQTILIYCIAVGTPIPLISWRLNWGPVPPPPRVTSTSVNGVGVLTIRNAQESDSGAYTCEAMNNKGYIFATPDAIVLVIPPRGICQAPFFNSDASIPAECRNCFCFDRSNMCQSSSLFKTQVQLNFNEFRNLKGVELVSRQVSTGLIEYINSSFISVDLDLSELIIIDFNRYLTEGNYYWALPELFLGNQLASYGGKFQYTIRYNPYPLFTRTDLDDIVIKSGDVTLVYDFQDFPRYGEDTTRELLLTERNWYRQVLTTGRGDSVQSTVLEAVTREEFLQVLSQVDVFMVRASYYNGQRDASLSNVSLEVGREEPTDSGRAFLVESCSCPDGYGGLSCERCASGYYYSTGQGGAPACIPCQCNGFSNQCDSQTGVCFNCRGNTEGDHCESCRNGFYGNPVEETGCLPCLCPLTEQPFPYMPTCFLDREGILTCMNCPPFQVGVDCGECEEGYIGDPRSGRSCLPRGIECNTAGTSQAVNGDCLCKKNAESRLCEDCVDGTFHMSEENQYGCISCFCMGITRDCSSTTYFRSQVNSQFTGDSQGFTLTDRLRRLFISTGLEVNQNAGELLYQDFDENEIIESYYWDLPNKFLGDKVSSYGGTLRYTIRIMNAAEASYMNGEPDVEIKGNGVTLLYRHNEKPGEDSGRSYSVPILEQFWTRVDGEPSTREFLLMALADLNFIAIRATYSSQPQFSVLQDVSLDIAEDRNTGLRRAYAVEQCVCPVGYTGLSCEDCDIGYTRAGGGLYLGLCEECYCNGHSDICDQETGVCQDCQYNTEGRFCDECSPGFYGNALLGSTFDCLSCPCPLTISSNQFSPTCYYDPRAGTVCNACGDGYEGQNCERCANGYTGNPNIPGGRCSSSQTNCDSRGTRLDDGRRCACKTFVTGESCDRCAPGYFNLDAANPSGCTICFCSGVTRECSSSDYYREPLRLEFDNRQDPHNVVLRNRQNNVRVDTGFHINPSSNEIAFNSYGSIDANQAYFWELPPRFRGDKTTAYGGFLSYNIYYRSGQNGQNIVDADIEIFGNDIVLLHRDSEPITPRRTRRITVQLTERNFVRPDSQPATREHFLMALSDLEYILIRSSYNTDMQENRIWDVSLDISIAQVTNNSQAVEVEDCDCPVGYSGLSCEDCEFGYTRSGGGLYLGLCTPCECSGHSQTCDAETGICTNCEDNTNGEFCQYCNDGFYGDATSGTHGDCRPCACPMTISSNQFSETCVFNRVRGRAMCDNCDTGYTGDNCEECAEGYYGNPSELNGRCTRSSVGHSVTVMPSSIRSIIGTSVTMYCNIEGNYDTMEWVRSDGQPLPPGRAIQQSDNSLLINNVMSSDNGIYICRVYTGPLIVTGQCDLTVTGTDVMVIIEEPKSLTVDVGDTFSFVCRGSSETAFIVAWMKQGGSLPSRALEFRGILTIPNAVPSDSGTYVCTVSNLFDVVTDYATVIVVSQVIAPFNVVITPRYQSVTEGDRVVFECTADGSPPPMLRWIRGDNRVLNPDHSFRNGVFVIPEVARTDEDEYYCEASNAGGVLSIRTILYVERSNRPQVTLSPLTLEVEEYQTVSFICSVTGDPAPTITWSKLGGSLSSRVTIDRGRLTIYRPRLEDGGSYMCSAVNSLGTDRDITVLTINREQGVRPVINYSGEKNISISQGSTLTLTCTATGTPQPTVAWSRAGGRRFASNMQVRDGILRILDVHLEDEDTYTCTARNDYGTASVDVAVFVERREAPLAEVRPIPRQPYVSGSDLEFECLATEGYPDPSVTWARAAGAPFSGNTLVENGVLMIRDVTSDEQGVYLCVVSNVAGSFQISITVIVLGLPQITISPEIGPAEYEVGEAALLECYSTGDPIPLVHWMKRDNNGGLILMDAYDIEKNRAVYYVSKLTTDHSGVYVCRAENTAGYVEKSIVVNVITKELPVGPPEIFVYALELTVIEGENASFSCSSPGSPVGTYTVTWRRVGQTMPGMVSVSGGILTFPVTRAEYSGQYYCIVGNSFGYMRQLVTLYVLSPPLPTVMPIGQTVSSGSVLRISCMAEGTGPMQYEWFKVGGPLSATAHEVDGMLEVTKVTAADGGEYRCLAQNQAGRSSAYATVTVQVAPQVHVNPARGTRASGASMEFHCQATGSPPPLITWTKEIGELPATHSIQGGILTLSNLQPNDEGVYICSATNAAGSRKAEANLILQAPPSVAITVHAGYQFATIGDSVTFRCRASGDPEPVISWTKRDSELPITVQINGGDLIIPKVELTDSGLYRCTATNAVGSRSSEVLLYVQAAPRVSVQPDTRSVSLGATVVFTCFATGSPFPEITWYKEDSDLFPDDFDIDSGVLTLRNVNKEDAGTYVCSATNNEGTVEYKASLIVGDLVPYFTQMPQSFITYPKVANALFSFEITISFNPESPEGLILYNGQSSSSKGDFLAFGLSGGHAEFRFDLGGGAAIIRSRKPLELGSWHTVTISRESRVGFMQVDDQLQVNGTSLGAWQGLDLIETLYLGGLPSWSYDNIPANVGFDTGFIGCVSQLVINDYNIYLTAGSLSMVNVDPCETCHSVACENGGECLEAFNEVGFSCRCREGFTGDMCESSSEETTGCLPDTCGEGMCIENHQSDGWYCMCPVGLTGERCQVENPEDDDSENAGSGDGLHMQNDYGAPIFDPSFVGDSYIAYEGLLASQHSVDITLMFKPNTNDDGLILFNGQRLRGSGDYVALVLQDRRLIFQYDSGSGPAVIVSNDTITAGEWYTVNARRLAREGSLLVNDGVVVKGTSPGTSRGLNLQLPLYLGGVEDFRDIPRALVVQKGFVGCITEVEIDDQSLNLVSDAIGNTNIHECTDLALCERMPCSNGGTCLTLSESQYSCLCPEDYTGTHCDILVGPCLSAPPCENGGSCLPIDADAYECMCPLGFVGMTCMKAVTLEDGAFFDGSGYLSLPTTTIPRTRGSSADKEVISFHFRTTDSDGVLLWQGVVEGEDGSRQDYIAVALRSGFLEFSFNLGSGDAVLRSRSKVNNGQEHSVMVSRRRREGVLIIDNGGEIVGESEGKLEMLNVHGNLYLGGTPDIEILTGGRFIEGAEVCISNLTVQVGDMEQKTVNFLESSSGINVASCTL